MSRYVVAYDIERDHQRSQVAKILLRYGDRVQKSVYLVDLEPDDLDTFRGEIGPNLSQQDAFELFPLDEHPGRPHLVWQGAGERCEAVILVG